jgi:hypothetical protein
MLTILSCYGVTCRSSCGRLDCRTYIFCSKSETIKMSRHIGPRPRRDISLQDRDDRDRETFRCLAETRRCQLVIYLQTVDLETETSTETILTQLEFFTDCNETLELRHHDVQFEDIIQFYLIKLLISLYSFVTVQICHSLNEFPNQRDSLYC